MKHLKDTSAASQSATQNTFRLSLALGSRTAGCIDDRTPSGKSSLSDRQQSHQRSSAGGGICHHGVGHVFRTDDRRN